MSSVSPVPMLAPIYTTPAPDTPVKLAAGRFGIRQGSYTGEGKGTLDLVWASRPKVRFAIPSLSPVGSLRPDGCTLSLRDLHAETGAHITTAHHAAGEQGASFGARGVLNANAIVGTIQPATHVIFHIVNFWDYLNPRHTPCPPEYDIRRVVFEGGGWRITLQAVPEVAQLVRKLEADSGRAITHAGKAERTDGSSISQAEAHQLFDALHSFFSFARGLWSPPILYVGCDAGGNGIWYDWTVRQASPWRAVLSWFPDHYPDCLAGVFPGFMRLWQQPDWQDILAVVIHWYVETSLQAGAVEGAVILCQNALERLAYYFLVHTRAVLQEQDFRPGRLSAAVRLRRLLTEFNLPLNLVANGVRINQLPALAQARGWTDAPEALVVLRNSIVHPDQHNAQRLQNYPLPARNEAWLLGLWYLELVLLKLFGYTGNYANRLTCRYAGEVETIP
jgi:hypothetical protein